MFIREYSVSDIRQMTEIWNEIVEAGVAFPQEDPLDKNTAKVFFASQSYCGVAEDEDGEVHLYKACKM